ncbi:MAG: hypothetical protein KDB79_12955, partial [Acidobacteria bacterium]|nr:hypothetical protein [Acidobacteriota bacterium]
MTKPNSNARTRPSRFPNLTYTYIAGMCLVLTILAVYSQSNALSAAAVLGFGAITTYSILKLYRKSDVTRFRPTETLPDKGLKEKTHEAAEGKNLLINETNKETFRAKDEFLSLVSHE